MSKQRYGLRGWLRGGKWLWKHLVCTSGSLSGFVVLDEGAYDEHGAEKCDGAKYDEDPFVDGVYDQDWPQLVFIVGLFAVDEVLAGVVQEF